MFKISHRLAFLLLGLCVLFNLPRSASADDNIKQGFKSLGNEILITNSAEDLKKKIFRYGNWYGPGYWGGSENPNNPGSKGPVDSLDEVAMRHDFAYLLAEQQGAVYGKEEELRLKGIADKIAVDEAKALPSDPRKWPTPPKGSVDYEDIKGYRERMISGFTMEKEGYKVASTLTKLDRINNDKLGAILDVTDQTQKFNEEDIKRRVKTLTKNWKNVTDFEEAIEDANLTNEQKKELFQKYKENPQGFQKTYTDYKKENSVVKSASQVAREKETAAIANKYNVGPSELLQFFNCVCRSSGGSLGGYYKPGKGGPCVATGPLTSWNTAMPSSKSAIYPCLNQLDQERYEKDQKIFDEMRQKDKEIERQRQMNSEAEYPKYLQLIQEENAKSAQAEVAQIEAAIDSGRFMEAADIWNDIKSLISDNYMITKYYDGKAQGENLSYNLTVSIKNGLLAQARADAENLELQNPLGAALEKIAKACSITPSSSNGYCEEMQAKYTAWEQNWNAVISKEAPAAADLIKQGKTNSAAAALQAISARINTQQLPPRYKDPVLAALREQIKAKQKEYEAALQENTKELAKLNADPDPRGVVRTIEAFMKAWEPSQMTLETLNYQSGVAAQSVRFAEDAEKSGDDYQKKELFDNAIERYRVSVKLQKDASVQRKLDSLLSRLAKGKEYLSEGNAFRQKEDIANAISSYKNSVAQWPDPQLSRIISQLEQQFARQSSSEKTNGRCRADSDCSKGLKCDPATNTCGEISITYDDYADQSPETKRAGANNGGRKSQTAGCRSDNDCPPGYVCDRGSGKCGSPFDDNYSSFGRISITRDDQRSEGQATRVAVSQAPTQKRGFSSNEVETDLENAQKGVALPPAEVLIDSPGMGSAESGAGESVAAPVSGTTAILIDTPQTSSGTVSEDSLGGTSTGTSPARPISAGAPEAETTPNTSSGPGNQPPVTVPPARVSIDSPVAQTRPATQTKPPAATQSAPPQADPGFDPKEFIGTWSYSGTRPDGKRRSGTMAFYFGGGPPWGGSVDYSIVDEDGQSNGKGKGTWTVVEGPADTARLTLNIGGKTWVGPISGGEDTWTFNSSHGAYTFRK